MVMTSENKCIQAEQALHLCYSHTRKQNFSLLPANLMSWKHHATSVAKILSIQLSSAELVQHKDRELKSTRGQFQCLLIIKFN